MAPQRQARNAKQRKTRKAKRIRKQRYPKTVRGHRQSTAGTIFPPLDVRSPKQLNEVMKRITNGPVTVLVVYADWCGHCHKLMPHIKNAGNMPNRNAQLISVNDEMLDSYNNTVNRANQNASPIEVDGYPSILLIDHNGNKLSEIAPTEKALNSAMVNVAPVAEAIRSPGESIIASYKRTPIKPRYGSPEEVMEEIVENQLVSPNTNRKQNASAPTSFEHLSNDEIISEEPVEESMETPMKNVEVQSLDAGVSPMVNNVRFSTNANSRLPSKGTVVETVPVNAISKSNGNLNLSRHEAEEITSLQAAPVSPDVRSDIRSTKVKGGNFIGGSRGGSLYGIMSQTAYRLAPAAVLLATAAAVMKRKSRGNKKAMKRRITRRR